MDLEAHLQEEEDQQHNAMPRDLEDEIFGGESDLSDVEADERQAQAQAVGRESRSQLEEVTASGGGLPKFKKERSSHSNYSSTRVQEDFRQQQQQIKKDVPEEVGGGEGEGEEATELDPELAHRQQLYARIDAAAGKNKTKRRRRKGTGDDLELMADEEVSRLRSRMLAAVHIDNEANEERRPATAKLVLLPMVTSTMQKSHLETAILDNGLLEAVKKWLEPLPDRSLPALNIQRSLFQLLSKMSIDTQSLKSSELGKVVLFYTKCPRVDPSIKRMADALVTSWLRPIIRRSASYRTRKPLPVATGADSAPQRAPSQGGFRTQSTNPGGSQRARIPETVHQAFHYAPVSQLNGHPDESGGGTGGGGGGSSLHNPAARKNSQKATAKKTREWQRKVQDAKKGQKLV